MKHSDDGLKQRLIGAVVLLALAVIFVPVLFDRNRLEPIDTQTRIPPEPSIESVVVDPPTPPNAAELAPEPSVMFVPEEDDKADDKDRPRGVTESDDVKSWVLQVASFRDKDHAQELTKSLLASGHSAFIRRSDYKNGPVHRVYIGPKLDKNALLELKAKVDDQYQVESMVLRFSPE